MNAELRKLIELLSMVLDENLDSELAAGLSEKIDWKRIPEAEGVYSNLFHFWSDEDIRAKDPEYDRMQKKELGKLIEHLSNKDFMNANRISFLGASHAS